MDERTYCLTPEQWRHAKACLTLAKRWGLIGDDSPEALERRRAAKNAQAERAEQDGKPVYGTRRFSAPDRKSTRLNSSHPPESRMPSSA